MPSRCAIPATGRSRPSAAKPAIRKYLFCTPAKRIDPSKVARAFSASLPETAPRLELDLLADHGEGAERHVLELAVALRAGDAGRPGEARAHRLADQRAGRSAAGHVEIDREVVPPGLEGVGLADLDSALGARREGDAARGVAGGEPQLGAGVATRYGAAERSSVARSNTAASPWPGPGAGASAGTSSTGPPAGLLKRRLRQLVSRAPSGSIVNS